MSPASNNMVCQVVFTGFFPIYTLSAKNIITVCRIKALYVYSLV